MANLRVPALGVSADLGGIFAFVQVAGGLVGTQGTMFIGNAGEGLCLQAKTGSVFDFTLYTPSGGFGILVVPTGTRNVVVQGGTLTVSSGVTVNAGGLLVSAGSTAVQSFGCNGAAAQTKATLGAASTDLATVVALANALRTMAINNGMGQT